MSKSYNNCIELSEDSGSLKRKVLSMFTDPARKRRNDPGHPDVCNVFDYYSIFAPDKKSQVSKECKGADRGCRECKSELVKILEEFIAPKREEKRKILKKKNYLRDILDEGRKKSRDRAQKTISEVKEALKI